MRRKLFLLFVFLISVSLQSQTFTMQNGVFSTCSGTFYDSGGLTGNYSADENYQITFCPGTPGNYIQLQFTAFDVEGEPNDFMKIYSGTGTSGPLLGTYGDFSPIGCSNGILSSDPSGCITITFESNGRRQRAGWEAIISCSTTPNVIAPPSNSMCSGAKPFCADAGTLEFPNLSSCDNVPDAPAVVVNNTCLDSAPNPAWYYLSVAIPGRIDLEIQQSTGVGGTGVGLDVDYAIWGPFPDKTAACADFTLGNCSDDHVCTGNVIDCSYSTAPTENATIPNALVGEIYMVLITNYDGRAGYISMTQTNAGNPGAGATDCGIVCPIATGTNPVCGNANGKITISGLAPTASYHITYLDDGVPVALTLASNSSGQIVITGLNAGHYTNILTDFPGCTTTPSNVVLNAAPPPAITGIVAPSPICYGTNAVYTFTGTPNAIVTYHINTTGNQTVTLSSAGSAVVTVNAITADTTITASSIALSGCSVALSNAKTVVVKLLPTIALSSAAATANQTVCIHSPIVSISYLINNATGATAANLPNGVTGTWNAGTFTLNGSPTQGGNFNYTITTNGGCSPTATITGAIHVTISPTAAINYAGTPFCKSASVVQLVTLTGTNAYTGGIYSATPAGLNINASSGAITPSTSIAGNYSVNYLVPASGGCSTVTASTTVTVTAVPTASISYASAPFCSTLTTIQPVTLTGTNAYTGGSYSATPAGLSISATTGAILPSGSAAGNYNVTYQIPASGGCAAVTVQTPLKVTSNPTAAIVYSGAPFCQSLSTGQSVNLSGTNAYSGGIYSATPTGLSINPATGVIVPSGSTAANYTVNYQVPAGGGCSSYTVSAPIKITAVPTASISYASAPFCSTLTTIQPVTLTGTNAYTGGVYTATPVGLSINASNGFILPSASNADSYVVTYNIPASGGCPSYSTTVPVTIKPTPVVSTTSGSMSLCSGDTTAIALNSSVAGTTFNWTIAQVNVDGVQPGSGTAISQTLTTITHGAGTAVYNVTPTASSCVGIPMSILVRVNPLPVPVLYDGVICINEVTNQVSRIHTFNAGLSDADYDFSWTFEHNPILGATHANYDAMRAGTYEVVATNRTTGCISFPVTAQVTATYAAQTMVTSGYEAFTETPMIVVNVEGSGHYLYQLDEGPQQLSNVFAEVPLGEHTVKVTDPDGCTHLTQTLTVIGYPKYFTPNNDGYHDSWNIEGFPDNQPAVIYIFDRYGKLLKQLSTLGNGWDGIYNGRELPSTDYWFSIDYLEKSQQKTFKSHFSLKR